MFQSRRSFLVDSAGGFGGIALAQMLLADTKPKAELNGGLHHKAKVRRVVQLFMNGGVSQMDTFDPKPALKTHAGKRPSSIAGLATENKTGGLLPSPFQFAIGDRGFIIDVGELAGAACLDVSKQQIVGGVVLGGECYPRRSDAVVCGAETGHRSAPSLSVQANDRGQPGIERISCRHLESPCRYFLPYALWRCKILLDNGKKRTIGLIIIRQ